MGGGGGRWFSVSFRTDWAYIETRLQKHNREKSDKNRQNKPQTLCGQVFLMCVLRFTCGDHRTPCGNWFYPSTTRNLGLPLRSSWACHSLHSSCMLSGVVLVPGVMWSYSHCFLSTWSTGVHHCNWVI